MAKTGYAQIKEGKQKQKMGLFIGFLKPVEEEVRKKERQIIQDVEQGHVWVEIISPFPEIKGKQSRDPQGCGFQKTEGDNKYLLAIRIGEPVFGDIHPMELIQEVVDNPRTKPDHEEETEKIELLSLEELPVFIDPETEETQRTHQDPIGEVAPKPADKA